MNSLRAVYHMARADFYERVRGYRFLIVLGLSVFLGYQVANGNLTLTLGSYRGEFNSAWVSAMISLVATFFIGWFGFYLVKGSVGRDRETGVGQIMAATPLTRPTYLLGKWLSNLAVLMAMAAVLALMGLFIQIWKGESQQIDFMAYLSPFLLIVLPCMGLVAAFAVLFESISFLQGGFGNVVYFIGFLTIFPLLLENLDSAISVFDPFGIAIMHKDMGEAARVVYPEVGQGFSLGPSKFITGTFAWTGIDWTLELILARLALVGLAVCLVLLAAIFFDRFDPSRAGPRRAKTSPAASAPQTVIESDALPEARLTPLAASSRRFSFFAVMLVEMKLLLKGQRWWWYAVAGALILACLGNPSANTRQSILPLAWAWPTLIWSALGNREWRCNVQQMTFSSAAPLWRQLPAQWLAGFAVALLMGSGAMLRFTLDQEASSLLALLSGAIFIPSLALAAGVWSGGSKLFEILYISILYIGPLNHFPALDFTGAFSTGRPEFFIPLSLALILLAFLGRGWQIRS
ncbi:MAG: ABC transporter permease subunit [Anaerolineales bacterium]|nr:ABC transporter permease subunit [Anaerolineales bacterium]